MGWRRRRPNMLIFQKAILWIWRCCNSAWELMSVTWHLRYAFPLYSMWIQLTGLLQEAYTRSKRVLNISVSSSRKEIPPLLNYLTAPNVVSQAKEERVKGSMMLIKLWLLGIAYLECSMLLNSVCGFIWIMRALGEGYRWQYCKVDDFSCKMESLVGDIAFWKVSIYALSPCFGWINMLMLCP